MVGAQSSHPGRLTELDALRGVGALCVMLFHYTTRFHQLFPQAPHVAVHFPEGDYWVLLFFTISGFSIFFTLDRIGGVADFAVNRFARLYPAYLVAMAITLAVEYGAQSVQAKTLLVGPMAILANLTMLQGFVFLPSVDGVYWTLSVEIAFYLCMIAIWRTVGGRRIELVMLGWLALRSLYGVWPDMPERIIMVTVLRYIPFFMIGVLAYRVWSGQRSIGQQSPYALLALLSVATMESLDVLLWGGLMIALFTALIHDRLGFLRRGPLPWLGGISYSFYLVHQHVGFVVLIEMGEAGYAPWIGFVTAVSVALVLGTAINRLVERPVGNAITRWWKRRRAHRNALAGRYAGQAG